MSDNLPTIGGLRVNEMSLLAGMLTKGMTWTEISDAARKENLLQTNKTSTAKRYLSYIKSVLSSFSSEELSMFVNASYEEKKPFIWLGYCRSFTAVADFASRFVSERFLAGNTRLTLSDYKTFVTNLVDDDRIKEPSPAVLSKSRNVIYNTLKELGYLRDETIMAAILSPSIVRLIFNENKKELGFFPISNSSVIRSLQCQ